MIYPKTHKPRALLHGVFFFAVYGDARQAWRMDLKTLLADSETRLGLAGVYSPREDAEKIVAQILHLSRDQLWRQGARVLSGDEMQQIESAMARRALREPIARIFSGMEFCGMTLGLAPGVFEPLPESESLIEHAVEFLKPRQGPVRVLDLGTGAGGLLLGVLKEIPNATGLGVDINEAAIQLARSNAEKLGMGARAQFQANDWSKGLEGKFDLIISNPPFIPKNLIRTLMPEVRSHDPWESLNGGRDGMRFYRRLAHDFPRLAAAGAYGVFQVSYSFAEQARRLFRRAGFRDAALCRSHYGMPVGISIAEESLSQNLISRLNRWRFGA